MRDHTDDPLSALNDLHQQLGPTFAVETKSEGNLVFDSRAETAHQVLRGTEGQMPNFKKSELQTHGLAKALGKENVLLATGDSWQSSRTALQSFFTAKNQRQPERIATMTNVLDRHFQAADDSLGPDGVGQVDVGKLFRRATLDVALNTLFSRDSSIEELENLGEAFEVMNREVGKEWLLPSFMTGSEESDVKLAEAVKVTRGWAAELVESRDGSEPKGDALDALKTAVDPKTGKPYSKERLISEVHNLMLGGHETTANLLTWIVGDLARSESKQTAVAQEIDQTVGVRKPNSDELRSLGGVASVWKEQAKENPPNYLLAREAVTDTMIGPEDDQRKVEAGDTVFISTQHANAATDGAMFSFGGGKRACIGMNMARLELEVSTTRFLQKFEVSDHGPLGRVSGITQAPADTIVTLKRRQG